MEPLDADTRYEILPFGEGLEQAERAPKPLTLTVTCSPRHGVDQMLDVAVALAEVGHKPVPHVAARLVRGVDHLESVLTRMRGAGLADMFLIGGDGGETVGPFPSAEQLLPVVDAHPLRPHRIGVAAYPEGHPLVQPATLERILAAKAERADYMVSQMCFDADTLRRWIDSTRERGIDLPLYVGIPGVVDRRRLLEVSMRIGVGASISFVRKQRGLRHLFGRPAHSTDVLYDAFAPLMGSPALGIRGPHFFTFNGLVDTHAWHVARVIATAGDREAQDA